jgi:hypothetical protein
VIRATNVIEPPFGEEQFRTKVVPRVFGERAVRT